MITLYDISSTLPGKAFSPNPFKARIALNYKGLSYKTEWVEYPDIESVCKKIGSPPTSKRESADGSDQITEFYTLPVIHDSKTGKVIADSFVIVQYLDETYPNTPRLIPHGMDAPIALFNHFFEVNVAFHYLPIVLPPALKYFDERTQVYYRETREQWMKMKLEDMAPLGPKHDEVWERFKQGLNTLAGFYARNKGNGHYFVGDTFTYADVVVGSFLSCPKLVSTKEEYDLEEVASWNEGLWGRIIDEVEKYLQVV